MRHSKVGYREVNLRQKDNTKITQRDDINKQRLTWKYSRDKKNDMVLTQDQTHSRSVVNRIYGLTPTCNKKVL